jgi:2-methylcitrate dehydratase PrpD
MQARFSMQYCAALALQQQRLRLADFTGEAVKRPAIRQLLPLISMQVQPAEIELGLNHMPHHDVAVFLKDGRKFETSRRMPKGSIAEPFDDLDRLEKFMDCCTANFGEARSKTLYHQLQAIDTAPNLAFLTAAFERHSDGV